MSMVLCGHSVAFIDFMNGVSSAELFDGYRKLQRPGANVGVLVSGPESLQISVAETCRSFNTINYDACRVAFSYHSYSFEL
jgi:ferric-chelate reductase